jgi:hypothetical protein
MKRLVLICGVILVVLLAACSDIDAEGNTSEAVTAQESDTITDENNFPVDTIDDTQLPIIPEHLSIDMDKIGLIDVLKPKNENNTYDDLKILQKKYPDLILVDSVVYEKSGKNEVWHSDTSGMFYKVGFDSDGASSNTVYIIYGSATSLITGLTAPVEIEVCMNLLDIPKSDWAIGVAPNDTSFTYYEPERFYDLSPDTLCFVIFLPSDKYEEPYGIKITTSVPGYVSPSDVFQIEWVGAGE